MDRKKGIKIALRIAWGFVFLVVLFKMIQSGIRIEGKETGATAYLAEFKKTGISEEILGDICYFPVAVQEEVSVEFEDSWMLERTYGGERKHEGIDIMAGNNKRGYFPVISMTDGTVENLGWLELGGYRIGIRSPHGGYFYYAHLDSYADLKEGDTVEAGQLLGYMGDSGYGKEGTKGQFAVHLHIGIYLPKEKEDNSINPYWMLKYLQERHTIEFEHK